MTPIERKRIEVSLANVRAARLANELKIDELKEAIARMEENVKISLNKEEELENQLKGN